MSHRIPRKFALQHGWCVLSLLPTIVLIADGPLHDLKCHLIDIDPTRIKHYVFLTAKRGRRLWKTGRGGGGCPSKGGSARIWGFRDDMYRRGQDWGLNPAVGHFPVNRDLAAHDGTEIDGRTVRLTDQGGRSEEEQNFSRRLRGRKMPKRDNCERQGIRERNVNQGRDRMHLVNMRMSDERTLHRTRGS